MNNTEPLTPQNPLDDYLTALLEQGPEPRSTAPDWDTLLDSAVSPYSLAAALDSSTLAPGYAPLVLQQPGSGCVAQRFTQLLQLLWYLQPLPAGRLRQSLLSCCQSLQYREAGYG